MSSKVCETLLFIKLFDFPREDGNLAIYPARGRLDLGRTITMFPIVAGNSQMCGILTCPPLGSCDMHETLRVSEVMAARTKDPIKRFESQMRSFPASLSFQPSGKVELLHHYT